MFLLCVQSFTPGHQPFHTRSCKKKLCMHHGKKMRSDYKSIRQVRIITQQFKEHACIHLRFSDMKESGRGEDRLVSL